jgi:flagellar hook assembly protein FlgD
LGTPRAGNLSVEVPIVRELLINVEAEPGVFTPNGDGINDQTAIRYDITNIARPSPVEILLSDLSGLPVRRLYAATDLSGRFARLWDGRNDKGERVPPGIYLFTVELKAGTGSQRQLGLVGVVY